MRSFILLSLISFNAFAMNWFDMDIRKDYTLLQDISLQQNERSSAMLVLARGEKFHLKEIIGLGMGLGLFNFEYLNCPGPQMETEVDVIPVEGTSPLIEVGAMVAEGCELWVYVELKDFWTKSFFE